MLNIQVGPELAAKIERRVAEIMAMQPASKRNGLLTSWLAKGLERDKTGLPGPPLKSQRRRVGPKDLQKQVDYWKRLLERDAADPGGNILRGVALRKIAEFERRIAEWPTGTTP